MSMPSLASRQRPRLAPTRTSVYGRSAAPMHVKCIGDSPRFAL